MNYFAHGRLFVDDPYFLAGTAVPDWLSVSDRRCRVRPRQASEYVGCDDERLAALARGIAQHHVDDSWFHATAAFSELSLGLTVRIRDALGSDEGMRPSFLGHILVELLLDAALIDAEPELLESYYAALARVDARFVQQAVSQMAARPAGRLDWFVPLFLAERFLCDYRDDARLLYRLNQVMGRVRLPRLPDEFVPVLRRARGEVAERRDDLLAGSVDRTAAGQ